MKVKVIKEKCINCGACVALCPEVFELDNEYKSYVKPDANFNCSDLNDAINVCPTQAIIIIEK